MAPLRLEEWLDMRRVGWRRAKLAARESISAGDRAPRIAYMCAAFPVRSETFVVGEVSKVAQRCPTLVIARQAGDGSIPASAASFDLQVLRGARLVDLVRTTRALPFLVGAAVSPVEVVQAWKFAAAALPHVRRFAPDVLHAHFATLPTTAALVVGSTLRVPVTAMFHANDYLVGNTRRSLRRRTRRLARVFAISADARSQIEEMISGPANMATPIDIVRASVDVSVVDAVPTTGITPTIVCVARLVPKKGHLLLIDGFDEFKSLSGSPARLIIIGDGPLRDIVDQRRLSSPHVADIVLTGALPHDETLSTIKSAAVAALVAVRDEGGDQDGIPVFLMEAAALGVPIVTTGTGGIAELVRDGETGTVILELTPGGVARALAVALSAAGPVSAGRARRRVAEEFDPDLQVSRLLATWNAVRGTLRRVPELGGS